MKKEVVKRKKLHQVLEMRKKRAIILRKKYQWIRVRREMVLFLSHPLSSYCICSTREGDGRAFGKSGADLGLKAGKDHLLSIKYARSADLSG